jgi:hypothetical protein
VIKAIVRSRGGSDWDRDSDVSSDGFLSIGTATSCITLLSLYAATLLDAFMGMGAGGGGGHGIILAFGGCVI